MEILIFLVTIFFSLNMGATSFAGSFATACGSNAISKKRAQFLFVGFAVLGAVLVGDAVAKTLGKGIVPSNIIDTKAVLIILTSATLSLFVANLMHIPQSTSFSTIASICGVGFFYHQIAISKINYLIVAWVLSTLLTFFLIYFLGRYIYPPRKHNFWIYEKVVQHKERLINIVVLTSCYKAFAQGTNNVANAVGPLAAAHMIDVTTGLLVAGVIFGIGAFTFSGAFQTSSSKIVPFGLLTATMINIVSGTITIIASKLGIPFPTVIVYTVSIVAIGGIKDGLGVTLENPITKKMLFTWCINPVITFFVSFLLCNIFLIKP